ncbi:hypothetical protein REIS_0791 [Rickettsia endosymbiont of Ixodes scapularis]|nr:hypothetical protein REIS_0791 [Rickettsia endosymbiont of Ixodes scapularis]
MKIYDLKNSHIVGGKDTSGHYEYVNNTNTTGHLDKFQDNEIVFYENPNDPNSGLKEVGMEVFTRDRRYSK